MQLKRAQEITLDDLPYIEAANFAVFEVESKYHQPFSDICNLDLMLKESGRPSASARPARGLRPSAT